MKRFFYRLLALHNDYQARLERLSPAGKRWLLSALNAHWREYR